MSQAQRGQVGPVSRATGLDGSWGPVLRRRLLSAWWWIEDQQDATADLWFPSPGCRLVQLDLRVHRWRCWSEDTLVPFMLIILYRLHQKQEVGTSKTWESKQILPAQKSQVTVAKGMGFIF